MAQKENHNVEFKEAWQEKSMATICAFANTNGGVLYIGKDDSGKVKGITNGKDLLTEIPNKITNILGFSPDVRLKKEGTKEYIIVNVKAQLTAVALRGKFYFRSGSTTIELKGAQLQRFLLDKSGQSWEDIIEEKATFRDLNAATIAQFKQLSKTRFPAAAKEKSVKSLLEKLHLLEKGKLTRAAILLFGIHPQKFYRGATFKIASFHNETALKNTDLVEGNLFDQVEHVMSLLKDKYLQYNSRIEGLYRKEELEYPVEALREAIINALIHKDYFGAHTQLRIDKDKLALWNYGELPSELTIERLRKKHQSLPRNPKIADIFYKAGLIEAWGRGTTKIIEELTNAGLPEPIYENVDGGFSLSFLQDIYTEEFLLKKGLIDRQVKGVLYLKKLGKITNQTYRKVTGASERTATRDLALLVEKKIIEQTGKTGKGTEYTLSGHKGAKGANKLRTESNDAIKTPKTPQIIPEEFDELDKKLKSLDKELERLDPDKDIKRPFDEKEFFEVLDSWMAELLKEFIIVVQRFNKYFTKPKHSINITNVGWVSFVNEKPEVILKKVKDESLKNKDKIQPNYTTVEFHANFGSLIKGGLDTFGCNYSMQIKFNDNWYELYMDDTPSVRNQTLQTTRLYHKPITKKETKELASKFGNLIYEHITIGINKIQEKNTSKSK